VPLILLPDESQENVAMGTTFDSK